MHDKFGNEVKVGDEIRFKGQPAVPGPDRKWTMVERQGVVVRLFAGSDSCNVEVQTVIPNARFIQDPADKNLVILQPGTPVIAQPTLYTVTARESEVVSAIDGRPLNPRIEAPAVSV